MGNDQLVGEVIRISSDQATIQVYEETGAFRQAATFASSMLLTSTFF